MELAKSFEPAEIERRWYPVWESRNYFAAGLDTAKQDNFCILLRRDRHSQLVYKHAISTVMPSAPIQLFEPADEEPDGE